MLTLTSVFSSSFTLLRKLKEYHNCATQSTQCSAITNRFTARVLRYKSKGRRRHGKLSKKKLCDVDKRLMICNWRGKSEEEK